MGWKDKAVVVLATGGILLVLFCLCLLADIGWTMRP